jgi:hypothetical protein
MMAKRPPRKKTKKAARVVKRRATAKSPRKKATKKVAKKKAAKKKVAKKKMAGRKTAAPKSTPKAVAKKAAKAPQSSAPRAAPRSLSGGVGGRPAGGRSHQAKRATPAGRSRKLNLRLLPHVGRAAHSKLPPKAAPASWPVLDEAPSETGLRERILLCVLSRDDRESAAIDPQTLAICRRQMWEWVHPPRALKDGRTLSALLLEAIVADEMAMLRETIGAETFDSRGFEASRAELLDAMRAETPPGP